MEKRNKLNSTIENLFTDFIKPALISHDGNCEIIDINQKSNILTISILYIGACSNCVHSEKETIKFIENFLITELKDLNLWEGKVNVISISDVLKRKNKELYQLDKG